MMLRIGEATRLTREVDIKVRVRLNGQGDFKGGTKVEFLNHALKTLAMHSGMDLEVSGKGDLTHHLVEDLAMCLGDALSKALGDRVGLKRFGCAYVPMDDALARAVVDLGGRPYYVAELALTRSYVEDLKREDLEHFLRSLAERLKASLHLHVLYGLNDHHKAEASIKALALALKDAWSIAGTKSPSVKGTLT
ncbi:MAG: imidazoleglycerol-phosphate dehydratase [Candidatus Bathyarchaeia archaeon]